MDTFDRKNLIDELNTVDRDALMERFARELPLISGELETTPSGIAWRTGLDGERLKLILDGKRKMKWSEYMSMLFVLWDDERGRKLVEERGFFPEGLKNAMTSGLNS